MILSDLRIFVESAHAIDLFENIIIFTKHVLIFRVDVGMISCLNIYEVGNALFVVVWFFCEDGVSSATTNSLAGPYIEIV